MKSKSKICFDALCQVCDMIQDNITAREEFSDKLKELGIKHLLSVELYKFLAYVAVSDGVISWNDSHFISELTGSNSTPESIDKHIRENNIYSTEFEEEIPLILQLLVSVDIIIYQKKGGDYAPDEELSGLLVKLYTMAAGELIEANGRGVEDLCKAENENLSIYFSNMQRYIDENLESHHVDIIVDYGKNTNKKRENGDVVAPKKNTKGNKSVKAPKKRA